MSLSTRSLRFSVAQKSLAVLEVYQTEERTGEAGIVVYRQKVTGVYATSTLCFPAFFHHGILWNRYFCDS